MNDEMRLRIGRYSLITYVIVGFLTFGHVYNNITELIRIEVENCPANNPSCYTKPNSSDRMLGSTLAGVAWPVYWGGKTAIIITK